MNSFKITVEELLPIEGKSYPDSKLIYTQISPNIELINIIKAVNNETISKSSEQIPSGITLWPSEKWQDAIGRRVIESVQSDLVRLGKRRRFTLEITFVAEGENRGDKFTGYQDLSNSD